MNCKEIILTNKTNRGGVKSINSDKKPDFFWRKPRKKWPSKDKIKILIKDNFLTMDGLLNLDGDYDHIQGGKFKKKIKVKK